MTDTDQKLDTSIRKSGSSVTLAMALRKQKMIALGLLLLLIIRVILQLRAQ